MCFHVGHCWLKSPGTLSWLDFRATTCSTFLATDDLEFLLHLLAFLPLHTLQMTIGFLSHACLYSLCLLSSGDLAPLDNLVQLHGLD